MPQIVNVGSGQTYTTLASWAASSDYSTDWGVGNPATALITGKVAGNTTINAGDPPNGALIKENSIAYDGTNSATCDGLTGTGETLTLRDNGLEVSGIFIESSANGVALYLGRFEAVDTNLHDVGVKTGLTGDNATAIQTYQSATFTGNIERVTVEGSGGYGIWLRNLCTGTIDHLTVVDAAANGSQFRDGISSSNGANTVTNAFVCLASTANASAEAFAGSYSGSSDFNAGDDTTAPGSNSLDNRTSADFANYAGGDFRTASGSLLATSGSGGGFIGAYLESGGGGSTLTADSGSYAYSGSAASLLVGRLLQSSTGTYNYTGANASLLVGRLLQADSGAYLYTGAAVSLLKGFLLSANTGSYSYSGTDVTLTFTPSGSFTLTADTGDYTYTGSSINFNRNRVIIAASGVYTYSGTDVQIILPGQIWTDKVSVSTSWGDQASAITDWDNQINVTTTWTDK